MQISESGLILIEGFESLKLTLYNCPAGHATIAYGHLVHVGPIDGRASEAPFVNGITRDQAIQLLRRDCSFAEHAIGHLITVPLTQNQFDALVSFTFNLGAGTLEKSTLRTVLNAGNYAAVPAEMKKFIYANHVPLSGLVTRRTTEAKVFTNGYC